jgi:hypothetical protein
LISAARGADLALQRFESVARPTMMKPMPPEGVNEEDYEAIEAAVMETVRGRWFLAEFARRSYMGEMRQMLDAMARLEQVVTMTQATQVAQMTPADPSVRLLVSRLKQVGEQLSLMAQEMRIEGVDEKYCVGIETQMRALGGLLRLNGAPAPCQTLSREATVELAPPRPETVRPETPRPQMPRVLDVSPNLASNIALNSAPSFAQPAAPRVSPHAVSGTTAAVSFTPASPPLKPTPEQIFARRFEALAAIDALPTLEKLRLFA